MTRIRIVCKAPPRPPSPQGYPTINGTLSDLSDVDVVLVRDDGTEESLGACVEAVRFTARPGEANRVLLVVLGAEIDVDADVVANVQRREPT